MAIYMNTLEPYLPIIDGVQLLSIIGTKDGMEGSRLDLNTKRCLELDIFQLNSESFDWFLISEERIYNHIDK